MRKLLAIVTLVTLLVSSMMIVPAYASEDRETIDFWYLWSGAEGAVVEEVIAAYNNSQDKYFVKGLSVPDVQKMIVAISSGVGPDVYDNFGNNMVQYAQQGVAMELDSFIQAEGFDLSVFQEAAMAQQQVNGKTYALPLCLNVYALYYNKALLAKAGLTEVPTTLEALEAAMLTNTVAENGVITELGGMIVPSTYWVINWALANGTNYGSADGSELTPDNAGFVDMLEYVKQVVDITGVDALSNYYTTGSSNYGNLQDPFVAGTQMFRVDGPWYYGIVSSANPDLDFGVAPFPGSEATGGSGYSLIESSNIIISPTTKHAEAAWDFLKYITVGEGSEIMITKKGDIPPTTAMLNNPEMSSAFAHFDTFFSIVNSGNVRSLPMFAHTSDYLNAITAAAEAVILGDTVDKAVEGCVATVQSLK